MVLVLIVKPVQHMQVAPVEMDLYFTVTRDITKTTHDAHVVQNMTMFMAPQVAAAPLLSPNVISHLALNCLMKREHLHIPATAIIHYK